VRLETFAAKHNFEIEDCSDTLPEDSGFDAKFWLYQVNNDSEPAAALYVKAGTYTLKTVWAFKAESDKTFTETELKALLKRNRGLS
jgi:hypothetical protein